MANFFYGFILRCVLLLQKTTHAEPSTYNCSTVPRRSYHVSCSSCVTKLKNFCQSTRRRLVLQQQRQCASLSTEQYVAAVATDQVTPLYNTWYTTPQDGGYTDNHRRGTMGAPRHLQRAERSRDGGPSKKEEGILGKSGDGK